VGGCQSSFEINSKSPNDWRSRTRRRRWFGHVELAITLVRRQRQLVENTEPSWDLRRALLEDELYECTQVDLFIDARCP
jgi:hypothetical protein